MLERVQSYRGTQVPIEFEPEGLGRRLQLFFNGATGVPLPDRMTKLADELEAAFERGDLGRNS